MRLIIIAIGLPLTLSACAGMGWTHPVKGQAALSQDEYYCTTRANAMYPPIIGYNTRVDEVCNAGNCRPVPVTENEDRNERMRYGALDDCMKGLGWRWKIF
jgi:hypothetical protein